MPIISLYGLNETQRWLASQLWLCDNLEEVEEFRNSIDEDLWFDLYLLMYLIFLSDLDASVLYEEDCAEARCILDRIRTGGVD